MRSQTGVLSALFLKLPFGDFQGSETSKKEQKKLFCPVTLKTGNWILNQRKKSLETVQKATLQQALAMTVRGNKN